MARKEALLVAVQAQPGLVLTNTLAGMLPGLLSGVKGNVPSLGMVRLVDDNV